MEKQLSTSSETTNTKKTKILCEEISTYDYNYGNFDQSKNVLIDYENQQVYLLTEVEDE